MAYGCNFGCLLGDYSHSFGAHISNHINYWNCFFVLFNGMNNIITFLSYIINFLDKNYNTLSKAGRGLETTYKGSMPSFRIDYLLFDNPMRAVSYRSIKEVPSDHKLLVTELQVGQLFQR